MGNTYHVRREDSHKLQGINSVKQSSDRLDQANQLELAYDPIECDQLNSKTFLDRKMASNTSKFKVQILKKFFFKSSSNLLVK